MALSVASMLAVASIMARLWRVNEYGRARAVMGDVECMRMRDEDGEAKRTEFNGRASRVKLYKCPFGICHLLAPDPLVRLNSE